MMEKNSNRFKNSSKRSFLLFLIVALLTSGIVFTVYVTVPKYSTKSADVYRTAGACLWGNHSKYWLQWAKRNPAPVSGLINEEPSGMEDLARDISRLGVHDEVELKRLASLLHKLVAKNSSVGYAQGMGHMAALVFKNFSKTDNLAETSAVLEAFFAKVERIVGAANYSEGYHEAHEQVRTILGVLAPSYLEPEFEQVVIMFISSTLMSAFASKFPASAARIWSVMMAAEETKHISAKNYMILLAAVTLACNKDLPSDPELFDALEWDIDSALIATNKIIARIEEGELTDLNFLIKIGTE